MNIFVDIDGTLTDDPEKAGGHPVHSRISYLRRLAEYHRIFLWSARGQAYVEAFARANGLEGCTCLPKPDRIIDDNPQIRPHLKVEHPESLGGK